MDPLDHAHEAPIQFAQHAAETVQLYDEQDAHLESEPIELDARVSGFATQESGTGVFSVNVQAF